MVRSDDGILVVLATAAAVMAAGYVLDVAGFSIHPWLLGVVALGALLFGIRVLPRAAALPSRAAASASCLVLLAVIPYALWMARPDRLPVTNGPDVVHHLLLIHLIAATGRLPHDAAQYPFLLEMMNYTPGSHILAAAAGAWLRVDPLFVVYGIAAGAAGLAAAAIHSLTFRLLGSTPRAAAQAFAAVLLALVPVYFFDAFIPFFFYAQVVSEAFAIGMLLALVGWLTTSSSRYLWLASACGVGIVLSWPVWIVPMSAAACVAAVIGASRWRDRILAVVMTLAPALAFGVVHQMLHREAGSILSSSGAVTEPSVEVFGLGFLVVAFAGVVFGVRERAARPVAALLGATVLISVVFALMARGSGPGRFYMAFKMMYLAVLPAAVLGGVALARASDAIAHRLPDAKGRRRAAVLLRAGIAIVLPLLVAGFLVRGRVSWRPPHASLTKAARDVGLWARDRVPPGCVDYFSRYWLTGYWLHLDVLGNPRLSDRMRRETFEFRDTSARWLEGRGLPYAIVEDLSAIPHEFRGEMEPMHKSGSFLLVRNLRPGPCEP